MKWKFVRYSLYITILFFVLTAMIFPWDLYPGQSINLRPVGDDFISSKDVYFKAVSGLIPWLILSPWSVVLFNQCSDLGCIVAGINMMLQIIFLFALYTIFFYQLIRSYAEKELKLRYRLFGLVGLIWFVSAGIGIVHAKRVYVDPPFLFNSYLSRLQELSNDRPFPPGTFVKDIFYNVQFSQNPATIFYLEYTNPADSDKKYLINLFFFENSDRVTCHFASGYPGYSFEPIQDGERLWHCFTPGIIPASKYWTEFEEGEPLRAVRYAAFLDQEGKIYIISNWIHFKESQMVSKQIPPIPSFFGYYVDK